MKFDPATVAQMSAFFANKEGGTIYVLKLMKLLYLADRLSIELFDEPISWDRMISMDNGPALSDTLNYINGFKNSDQSRGWDDWIKDRENHQVSTAKDELNRNDLDHLSDADIDILENIWSRFGHMTRWEIRDYTHDNCPEWKHPKGSSNTIDYEDVLREIGRSSNEIIDFYQKIREQRKIDILLTQN